MEYIKVENGIVIAIIDTDNPKKLNLPENNEGVEGKGKWLINNPLPSDNEVTTGDKVKDFDKKWKRKIIIEK